MKLIIDIDKDTYKTILGMEVIKGAEMINAIKNGTPIESPCKVCDYFAEDKYSYCRRSEVIKE